MTLSAVFFYTPWFQQLPFHYLPQSRHERFSGRYVHRSYRKPNQQTFTHAEGYVKKDGANYIYHYIYRDHLGNNRLVYADLNNNGTIEPATEIVEENNYYPFGLKHQGYNDLPGVGYKYKFLNKEYEDSFGLNVTETDFRQYDAVIGRFNVMDVLSELAPNQTPYRYGFNNPVLFSDPSGLFETWDQAINFMLEHGMSGSIMRSDYDDTFVIAGSDEFSGRFWENFYETSYHPIVTGQGGGSDDSPGFKLLGFSPSEIGTLATTGSVFANGLEGRAQDNANYKYKYGSKTHTAQQLTELNKARMNSIAKGANALGRAVGITGATIAVYDAFENPTTANIIKASVNVGLLFVRMNPVTGVILGISDLSGFSDYIYNGVGNMIDNY